MKCTSCNDGSLIPSFIDGLFRAHVCSSCGGNWVLIEDYMSWKEQASEYVFPEGFLVEESDMTDSKHALFCPVTGAIMRKFRISTANNHRVDYSAMVGGLWLDKGEWELLKSEGLAGCLNAVVTQSWQRKLRQTSAKESFADIYEAKFGHDNYLKIKEIREWLISQENKADLRAYLLADDPYSADK